MFNLNKRLFKQALDLSPVATVIVDLNGQEKKIAYVNQAFEALSGYDSSELLGRSWNELAASDITGTEECSSEVELECHPRLGVSDQLQFEMLPLYDRPGTPQYWVGTERQAHAEDAGDVEREALLAVLRDARMHLRRLDGRDSTTGILSRRAFEDLLQRDWVMARREQRSLGVMVFRLDGFDAYREVYGRHAANSCLRKVAHAITGSLKRASDLTARYSDDQFSVLVGQCEEAKVAELASRIAGKVRGLSIHHPRSPVDRFVTLSFGVAAVVPAGKNTPDALLQQAESSLTEQPVLDAGLSAI